MDVIRVVVLIWVCYTHIWGASGTFCGPEPELCADCGTKAFCQTLDKNVVIPQTLPETLLVLDVLYVGNESVSLNSSMFDRYKHLTTIILLGEGITSVEGGTFSELNQLKSLSLHATRIQRLPKKFLPISRNISAVDFSHNLLASIPYHLFDDMPHVVDLNLGFNSIIIQNCSTIGWQFSKLTSLKSLELSNIAVFGECEGNVTADFFAPIQSSVRNLNLTSANIYGGDPKIFKDFQQLEVLDISLAKNFLDCPSNATDIFHYLPQSLETLIFRRWRTDAVMKSECAVTNEMMAGLKQLPRLTRIDMRYGDFMFGEELKETVFSGFEHLSELNVGYCRFSIVEEYAFAGCPNLTSVTMDANPIASQPIRLFRDRGQSQLKHLRLREAYVYSDYSQTYHAEQLFVDAPIEWVDLQKNYISRMPFFINNETILKGFNTLKRINLDFNFLVDFQGGGNLSAQCKYLPNLKELTVSNNKLRKVTGLCSTITNLSLAFNELDLYWHAENQNVISKLHQLERLDISYNQLKSISPHFVSKLTNLIEFQLTGNDLASIDSDTFYHHGPLQVLDLRANHLIEFNYPIVQQLLKLERLLLQNNEITLIDEALIRYIDESNSSIKMFGIIGNPLSCNCDQHFFQKWIKETNKVPFANRLECSGPTKELKFQKVYDYKRDDYSCDYKQWVTIILSVVGGIIGAVIIALPCYKYRWYIAHLRVVSKAVVNHLSRVRLEHKCLYDAYVMYNSASDDDLTWVVQDLRLAIETDASADARPFKLYLHDRDALPGSTVYTEMISAMEKSRKIIIVLSNSFLKKAQCNGQADLAGRESYGRKVYQPNRIMVLVTERLDEEAIQAPFTSLLTENVVDVYNYNENRMKRAWQRIRTFLTKPKYEYVRQGGVYAAEEDL